jgi:hypothetical protein
MDQDPGCHRLSFFILGMASAENQRARCHGIEA